VTERVKVLPKQMQFLRATEPEVLYSGAFGAGKSRVVAMKVREHAKVPGNFVGLCRKTYAELKDTTLRVMLKADGDLPPVLPEGTYQHNKTDHIIHLHGGGDILYFGFDDPLRVASLNLGAVGVDEGIELTAEEYTMLLGRLRNVVDPVRQIFTATNPGPPSHFLHARFYDNPSPDKLLIEANALENHFLPADYLVRLSQFEGTDYQRYVLGKWTAYEGLVYEIDRETHVKRLPGPWKEIVLGVDEGYTNPAAVLVCGIDADGRGHVFREIYEAGLQPSTLVKLIADLRGELGVRAVYCDPSAAGLIADLRAEGIDARSADNAILDGIRTVKDALAVAEDGRPRLTISPECPNTLRELESYCWKLGRDVPVKKNDHAPDALRYLLHSAKRGQVYIGGLD